MDSEDPRYKLILVQSHGDDEENEKIKAQVVELVEYLREEYKTDLRLNIIDQKDYQLAARDYDESSRLSIFCFSCRDVSHIPQWKEFYTNIRDSEDSEKKICLLVYTNTVKKKLNLNEFQNTVFFLAELKSKSFFSNEKYLELSDETRTGFWAHVQMILNITGAKLKTHSLVPKSKNYQALEDNAIEMQENPNKLFDDEPLERKDSKEQTFT